MTMISKPFVFYDSSISLWVLLKSRRGMFLAYCYDLVDVIDTITFWKAHGTLSIRRQPIPCA